MSITYPSSRAGQIAWWKRRLDYAISYWKPIFEPSKVLVAQYNNEAATTREKEEIRFNTGDSSDPGIRNKANIVFGYLDQSIANIAAHDPTFSVHPFNKAGVGAERVVARISDYWYRETDQLIQDKKALLDSYVCPFGGCKIGYAADIEGMLIQDPIVNPGRVIDDPVDESLFLVSGEITTVMQNQNHPAHIEVHTQFLQQPNTTPERAAIIEAHIEDHNYFLDKADPDKNTTIKWESPYGIHWKAGDIIIDPMASDGLRDANWIAFRYVKHIDEISYQGDLNTEGLEPNFRMENAPDIPDDMELDDFGLVEGYEIFAKGHITGVNRKENLWIDMTRDHDSFLRYETEWPMTSLEDFPCEILTLADGVVDWHTKGPLIMGGADSMQSLVNEILDSYLSVIRKQKNLFLYDPRYIREEEIDAILEADDMESFEVEGLVEAQGRAVQAIQFGDVPPEKGEILRIVQTMFDRANGTPQPISMPQSDTATEANIQDRRNTAREDERAEKFASYQVRKARKFWQLTTEFRPDRLFLIDPRAGEFVKVTEELSSGEYGFEINVSSAATATAIERKQWMDLINLAAGPVNQLIMQENNGVGIKIAELVKDLLVRGYRIQDPERILPFLEPGSGDLIDPGAAPQGGGMIGAGATDIASRMAGPQGAVAPQPSSARPVPTESALIGEATRVDRGGTGPNSAVARTTAEGR